jgi:hypothetical protein
MVAMMGPRFHLASPPDLATRVSHEPAHRGSLGMQMTRLKQHRAAAKAFFPLGPFELAKPTTAMDTSGPTGFGVSPELARSVAASLPSIAGSLLKYQAGAIV